MSFSEFPQMGALRSAELRNGVGGAALQQAFSHTSRSTPADDVVAAVDALNRAVQVARAAGWTVQVTAKEPGVDDVQSTSTLSRIVRASISKDV